MPNCRSKANALANFQHITQDELGDLKAKGAANRKYWGTKRQPDREVIRRFKKEIKDYYFVHQSRRCCYCSFELQDNHATFDAEHIIDKKTYPQLMFDPQNLAASCKRCNNCKKIKSPLIDVLAVVGDNIPLDPASYRIVHPHLDEWSQHLYFDGFDRIKASDEKGQATIEVCGILALNVARLADHFQPAQRENAEKALRSVHRVKGARRRGKLLDILKLLAEDYGLAQARAVVGAIEQEFV